MSLRNIREESLAEKRRQIETNPCFDEQSVSLKCIEINSNDTDQCFREINNLKICRTFWSAVEKVRKNNSIEPTLPKREVRDQLRKYYIQNGNLKTLMDDKNSIFYQ
ncbi:coiled-coil-helix-coiled-coil-helix domain-containing protein 7-like [Oppia nitens]|uniref:coiled-coil-helix-coiled-coil-helix domain-containing protein 7-like n=1 Tax=Oppia nitens TaxID=1686743 RepID=UPI0023DAD51B|nr:coiled-coil-helix-coiled-coil-helix domain-containing protein 7-like [Oppia nitens]